MGKSQEKKTSENSNSEKPLFYSSFEDMKKSIKFNLESFKWEINDNILIKIRNFYYDANEYGSKKDYENAYISIKSFIKAYKKITSLPGWKERKESKEHSEHVINEANFIKATLALKKVEKLLEDRYAAKKGKNFIHFKLEKFNKISEYRKKNKFLFRLLK